MMIDHDFVRVDFFRAEFSARTGNLKEVIADAIT
jgi:hypothetical protein